MENTIENSEVATPVAAIEAQASEPVAPAKRTKKPRATKAADAPKVAEATPTNKTTKPKATKTTTLKPKKVKTIIEQPVVEEVSEVREEKTPLQKGIEAGKATRKIITDAGTQIIDSSIQTTQALADIYKTAGKKAFELGKEVVEETVKVVTANQKKLRNTSTKAFKKTVETIKESNLIENPLKKKK
ncbi:MAG: hypothetical protein R2822_29020 [Spirosomataceae bacterium]